MAKLKERRLQEIQRAAMKAKRIQEMKANQAIEGRRGLLNLDANSKAKRQAKLAKETQPRQRKRASVETAGLKTNLQKFKRYQQMFNDPLGRPDKENEMPQNDTPLIEFNQRTRNPQVAGASKVKQTKAS